MTNHTQRNIGPLWAVTLAVAASLVTAGCAAGTTGHATTRQTIFRTPEKAVQAISDLAGTGDVERGEEIFGAGGVELLRSGDDVADRQGALKAKEAIAEKVTFEDLDSKTKIVVIGKQAWQFPIPLVRARGGWRFDTEAGREEMSNRRIGRNELSTIATLHAIVDAQKEYFDARYGGKTKCYAKQVISSEGKRDGLYWPTAAGEKQSPLGPLIGEATAEGYSKHGAEPVPYHGYYYRPLTAQGRNAPGGAKSYLDAKGLQTQGFAILAWPAKHGSSGVMTFIVGKQGLVFQKDLGAGTSSAAAGIKAYDPDDSWVPTAD